MVDDLTVEQCWAELRKCEVGHIAVISRDEPYVTPVSFVANPPHIAFRTVAGRRLDAMKTGGVLCFEATNANHDAGAWTSVVAWGRLAESGDIPDADEIVHALYEKYHVDHEDPFRLPAPEVSPPQVVVVHLDRLTGRRSGLGLGARLRPGRL